MFKNGVSFILLYYFVFCIESSHSAECSNQTVNFDASHTDYYIISNSTDLDAKICKYKFTVPAYFVPTIIFSKVTLTANNTITTRQFSEYGGVKTYKISVDAQMTLAPVDFTIELNLSQKTTADSFNILISVKDCTPSQTGGSFIVTKELGKLIDSYRIVANSVLSQTFDNQNPPAKNYTIKIVLFTDGNLIYNLLMRVFVYDQGVYKGSLLDVYDAQNSHQICHGSQFSIVNSLSSSIGTFTVLISQKHDWNENQVLAVPPPPSNTSAHYSATNGLTVYHVISNPIYYSTPTIIQQITFVEGNGSMTIYAGCVTGDQEAKRIAFITPSTAANYENLEVFGRCRTYVLTKGVLKWNVFNYYPATFNRPIGSKGVIMSETYPYINENTALLGNFLIQAPDMAFNENIIVTYEVADIGVNVSFHIQQYVEGGSSFNKTLSATDIGTSFTSMSTFQQYIKFAVPQNSEGFLVRFTVTSSSCSTTFEAVFAVCLLSLIF